MATAEINITIMANKSVLPNLRIRADELSSVLDYDSLAGFLKKGTVLVVGNKTNPKIKLVGRLKKERDAYFIEGAAFEQATNGKNQIMGKNYLRPIKAKYGLTREEFEKRKPHYIANSRKSFLVSRDIITFSRVPQGISGGRE